MTRLPRWAVHDVARGGRSWYWRLEGRSDLRSESTRFRSGGLGAAVECAWYGAWTDGGVTVARVIVRRGGRLAALACLVLASACGSGDDDPDAAPSASTSAGAPSPSTAAT